MEEDVKIEINGNNIVYEQKVMNIEDEVWLDMGEFVHQDFLLMYPSIEAGLIEFTKSLDQDKKDVFKKVVTNHLKLSDGKLVIKWYDSGADIIPNAIEIRRVLKIVISKLEKSD